MILSILIVRYISTLIPTILLRLVIFKMITREKKLENLYLYSLSSFIALYENDIVVNRIDDYLNIPQIKLFL
jgi:hypothetical protein